MTLGRFIYFGTQFFRGEPVMRAMQDIRKTEFLPLADLKQLQFKRLKDLLQHSLKIPFYQDYYKDYKSEINGLANWNGTKELMRIIPPLGKELVHENYDDLIYRQSRFNTTRNITSGSTGEPFAFQCDNLSWAYRHAAIFRCLERFGVSVGEPYGYIFGTHWSFKSRFESIIRDRILNRVRVSAFDITEKSVHENLKKLKAIKATHIIGYPSALYDFAFVAKSLGLDLESLNLKVLLTTAEPLLDYQREYIQSAFKASCISFYGSVEGGQGAYEVPEGYFIEFMEGTWLDIDNEGQIFSTDLFLRTMPLVKFQTGDFAEPYDGDVDYRWNQLKLRRISGRSGKSITLPNGRKINANLPSYVFKLFSQGNKIRKYRFYQFLNSPEISLLIKVGPEFNSGDLTKLKGHLTTAFGDSLVINTKLVDNIPHLPNAKHQDYVLIEDEKDWDNGDSLSTKKLKKSRRGIYPILLDELILPVGERIFGFPVWSQLKNWEKIEQLSVNELRKLQNRNFRKMVHHALTNIKYYSAYKIDPDTVQSCADLVKLPILTKSKIKANLKDLHDPSKPLNTLLKFNSSGSSGEQGVVYMSQAERANVYAIQTLWWEWSGYKPGDPMIQTGMTPLRDFKRKLKDYFFKTSYFIAYDLSERVLAKLVNKIRGLRPKYLMGYASSLFVIAKYCHDNHINDIRFEAVVS